MALGKINFTPPDPESVMYVTLEVTRDNLTKTCDIMYLQKDWQNLLDFLNLCVETPYVNIRERKPPEVIQPDAIAGAK